MATHFCDEPECPDCEKVFNKVAEFMPLAVKQMFCDAGGSEEDMGHKFNRWHEYRTLDGGTANSLVCRCGAAAIDFGRGI